jgi:hypothetical protein
MTLANSFKSTPWRLVLGLVLAVALGWGLAYLLGRPGAQPEPMPLAPPAVPAVPRSSAMPSAVPGSGPLPSFEQLMQKQAQISEGAQRAQLAPPQGGASAAAAGSRAAAAGLRPDAARDAQMRAAGVPSVIDLEKLRLTLESTDRMQELGRQLIVESEKGRGADPARVKALSAEIQAAQKNIPQQFIRNDVLQRQLSP